MNDFLDFFFKRVIKCFPFFLTFLKQKKKKKKKMVVPLRPPPFSPYQPADGTLTTELITAAVLNDIKKKLNANQIIFKEYATQIVQGTYCRVKGTANGKEFEALVFKPLRETGVANSLTHAEFTK
jgi:hypothetical protein